MKGQIMATKSQSKYVKILNPSKKRAPKKRTLSSFVQEQGYQIVELKNLMDVLAPQVDRTTSHHQIHADTLSRLQLTVAGLEAGVRNLVKEMTEQFKENEAFRERIQATVDVLVRDKNKLALDINDRFKEWVDFKAFSEAVMKDIKNLFHRSETNGRMLVEIEKRISPKMNPVKLEDSKPAFNWQDDMGNRDFKPGPIIRKTEEPDISFDRAPIRTPFINKDNLVVLFDRTSMTATEMDVLRSCYPCAVFVGARGLEDRVRFIRP